MNRSFQAWQMKAKAAGYPLCVDCQEPLPKTLWGKQTRCRLCQQETDLIRQRMFDTTASQGV